MLKEISFNYKGRKICVNAENCNFPGKFFGLMFESRENARALLFEFRKPVKIKIHSLFVFFPFAAIWLDDKNKIVDFKIVKPFNFIISPKKLHNKLVEIPVNKKYRNLIKLLQLSYA